VLAKHCTVSPSGYNYTFALRQYVHFSNGHQFNSYVMWFSLYRGIVMNQAGSFILQENFWYPGLTYYATAAQNRRAATQMAGYLNSFDFQNPVAADLAVMMAPDQSFRVVDRFTIELNMGYGYLGTVAYSFLLAAIADIKSGAVAGLSFAYVGPSQIDSLTAAACVDARLLDIVYGSTAGGWWIYMNQNTDPFTDPNVRAAVVHAINYDNIISRAFN